MDSYRPSDAVMHSIFSKASLPTQWKMSSLCRKNSSLTDSIHSFELFLVGPANDVGKDRRVRILYSFYRWMLYHSTQIHEMRLYSDYDDPCQRDVLLWLACARNVHTLNLQVPLLNKKMDIAWISRMLTLRHLDFHDTFDQSTQGLECLTQLTHLRVNSLRADLADDPMHLLEITSLQALKTLQITDSVGNICLCGIDHLTNLEHLSIVGHDTTGNVVQEHTGLSKLTKLKTLKLDIPSEQFDERVLAPLTQLQELYLGFRNVGCEFTVSAAMDEDFELGSGWVVFDAIGDGSRFPHLHTLGFLDASPMGIQMPVVECLHTSVLALEDMGLTLSMEDGMDDGMTGPIPRVNAMQVQDACSSGDWDALAVRVALRALQPKHITLISNNATCAGFTLWLGIAQEFSISYEEC